MTETIKKIKEFMKKRDWNQFHAPVNLSKSIVIEAAELLECFQWSNDDYNKEHVCEELADVLIYCVLMAEELNVDIEEIMMKKLELNRLKYPVEKAKGNSKKYTEFEGETL